MDNFEPTEEELKNGWTTETLRKYINSREIDEEDIISPVELPIEQVRQHPFKR